MQGKALVLLAGRSKSGKNFFARHFTPYMPVIALADRLKHAYADTIGVPVAYMYGEDTKERYRQGLIDFSERIMKPLAGKDVWARAAFAHHTENFPSAGLLISDCRYPEEVKYFENHWQGKIVKVLVESSFSQPNCGFCLDNMAFDVYVKNERQTDLLVEFHSVLRKAGL